MRKFAPSLAFIIVAAAQVAAQTPAVAPAKPTIIHAGELLDRPPPERGRHHGLECFHLETRVE